ncbi:MAG: type II toxin-antitoxin system prevent-host-death family antitoxin [Candidatus Paceibacterota bacterium]
MIKKEKITNIVGLKELRENMEKYIGHIKKGRSFTVVRRSRPIFKVMPVDEWGDEGTWETIADFTKIRKGGVPAEEFLKALRNLREQDRKIS